MCINNLKLWYTPINILLEAIQMKYIRSKYEYRDEFRDFPCAEENVIEYLKLINGDEEIGIGVIGKNVYHPYCDQVYVYIDERYRRMGYGSGMLSELKSYSTDTLACSAYSSSGSTTFLNANGFEKLRSCWEYDVGIEDLIYSSSSDLHLITLDELSETERKLVENQLLLDYKFNHQWVSPMSEELSDLEWIERLTRDVDEEWSRVYILNGDIGYMIVGNVNEDELDIFYVGGNIRGSLLKDFLVIGVRELFGKNKVLNLELDSTDEVAMVLKSSFRKTYNESYDTYICK